MHEVITRQKQGACDGLGKLTSSMGDPPSITTMSLLKQVAAGSRLTDRNNSMVLLEGCGTGRVCKSSISFPISLPTIPRKARETFLVVMGSLGSPGKVFPRNYHGKGWESSRKVWERTVASAECPLAPRPVSPLFLVNDHKDEQIKGT